jgi:RNA polymerase sigma-70 factor (ECF subfamily)
MIPSEDSEFENQKSGQGLPETDYIEQEVLELLQERCNQLKPPYDEIARMYFVEEHNAEEIAEMKQKNLKTIQTQVYRARAMLRKIYGKERG